MIVQITTYKEGIDDSDPRDTTKTVYFDGAQGVEFSNYPVEIAVGEGNHFKQIYPWSDFGHWFVDDSFDGRIVDANWVKWHDKHGNTHIAISTNTIYILNDEGKTIGRAG